MVSQRLDARRHRERDVVDENERDRLQEAAQAPLGSIRTLCSRIQKIEKISPTPRRSAAPRNLTRDRCKMK